MDAETRVDALRRLTGVAYAKLPSLAAIPIIDPSQMKMFGFTKGYTAGRRRRYRGGRNEQRAPAR
jgi:hypothetical protein